MRIRWLQDNAAKHYQWPILVDEFFPYKESIPKQDIRSALKPLLVGVAMNIGKTLWLWKPRVRNSAESIEAYALVRDHSKPFEVACDDCDTKLIELARLAVNSRIENLKILS